MALKKIKERLRFLSRTPFHPQWLMRSERASLATLLSGIEANKRVLDIGCFDSWPRSHIDSSSEYVGLDYYETAAAWYHSVPNIYGDARHLPFSAGSFDVALLFDVLEHVEDSEAVLGEIYRVLKPGGELILSIPFLYPLHDEPRDFVRHTRHGLAFLADKTSFEVGTSVPRGSPITTSALLGTIAIAKMCLNLLERKSPWLVLAPFLLTLVPCINLLAWLLSLVEPEDGFMPYAYHLKLIKPLNQ